MEKAIRLYRDFWDMDINDYAETAENDVLFVAGLIDALGENGAREFLQAYFN